MGAPRVWSPLQGCAPWALKRVAPLGLAPPSKAPRVWSPFQGYAPWALKRIAPLGLAPPPSKAPRVWSPFQGCAPWALERIAPLGLAPPPSKAPNRHANPNGRVSPYRGDPLQSPGCAALKGQPNPGNTNHCASPTAVHSPTTAQTPTSRASPDSHASPYRGDPLQSPGCAALKGRPNPGNTNHHTPLNHHANTNRRTTPNHHAPRPPPPHSHSPEYSAHKAERPRRPSR